MVTKLVLKKVDMEIQKTWIIYVLAQNLYQFKYHITFLLLLHRTQQLVMCMIFITLQLAELLYSKWFRNKTNNLQPHASNTNYNISVIKLESFEAKMQNEYTNRCTFFDSKFVFFWIPHLILLFYSTLLYVLYQFDGGIKARK